MSVYRVRPAVEGQENSDDDAADTALHVTPTELADALQTKLSSHGKRNQADTKDATDGLMAEALRTAEEVWATDRPATWQEEKTQNAWAQVPAEAAIRAAKQKQRNLAPSPMLGHEVTNPAVALGLSDAEKVQKIHVWLHSLDSRECNAEQQAFCRKVAERVLTEMQEDANQPATHEVSEPLRWALHGGPGTGKSYTLNLVRRELFEQILGWQQGIHFQVVTLQAVMAEQLDGDTIHHALGLNWNGASNGISEAKLLELCATTLQWRWLFIDEISMVSAELLARLELRCRELVRDISARKFASNRGEARCFGGLNVCFSGDLWQLPPPRGTFLGEVPWEMLTKCSSKKLAQTIHGQELIWGYGGHGLQGMTELVQCELTHDEWLQELQDQLRHGQLSDENHLLHGRMTKIPGSVCKGRVTCGQANCQRLMQQQPPASIVWAHECSVCKSERASKALVLHGKPRDANFAQADAILPTNAVKYHVNELRAQEWAKQHQERMRYAIGQDRISSAALREKPDLMNEKLEWLQRHDQECGSLYGILPLCMGLPVRATDHIDRAKGILRGRRGVVVGWSQEHETESCEQGDAIIWNTLPVAIYVRFDTAAKWVIDGLQQANVYPVSPQRKQWHLDKHRQRPVLRVTRRQYPLAPAFAATAHAAQGQTAQGQVVADLHIGPSGDPLTAYVAVTRVTGRNNLAILRPFDPKPYQQGTRLGRVLLLRVWRGEEIDWEVLRAKYLEEKPCAECSVRKRKNEYTAGQWKRNDDKRICKECVARHVENGEPWQCSMCCCWRGPAQFPAKHQKPQCAFYRACLTCKELKKCDLCDRHLEEKEFSKPQWTKKRQQRMCAACQKRGHWTCSTCNTRRLQTHFSSLWGKKHKGHHGRQQCNMCIHTKHARQRTYARLQRRRRKIAEAKVAKVLQAVRTEIQQMKRKQHARNADSAKGAKTIEASPTENKRVRVQVLEPQKNIHAQATEAPQVDEEECGHGQEYVAVSPCRSKERSDKQLEYECPYCHVTIYSTVKSGNVQTAGHCGKQFRVRSGVVARSFAHACPKCGQQIQSANASGRIQSTHKRPDGKTCPRTSWVIK